jgi:hypothetical protein
MVPAIPQIESIDMNPPLAPNANADLLNAAYRYGWESRSQFPGEPFCDVEPELKIGWESSEAGLALGWEHVRAAVRDGWYHAWAAASKPR